jgi:adenylate cyclase
MKRQPRQIRCRVGARVGAAVSCQILLLVGAPVSVAALEPGGEAGGQAIAQAPSAMNSLAAFEALLRQRQLQPQRATAIDAEIEARFGQKLAVVVMDMAGFSQLAVEAGIIPSLAQVYRVRSHTIPVVEAHGGRILKLEADNVYAVFPTAEQALMAMETVLQRLRAEDLHASIGIGFGEVLVVGERDVFGHEMNLASKLGEDVAAADEILLTAAAYAALPRPLARAAQGQVEVSGLTVPLYRLSPLLP